MGTFVGLDVSLKEISVCILDGKGGVVFEGKTAADPFILTKLIRANPGHKAGGASETDPLDNIEIPEV